MQLPPPSVIASWPEPNFVDPVVRGEAGMVVGLLISVLVTVTLAIRFYARKFLTRGFGLDDIFILLAYLPATAFTLIGVIEEKTSQGNRHTWDVELNPLVTILKLALANSILFELATSLTKLSMLALFYRLTTASRDWKMTIIVLTSIVFISLNSLIFIMVSICQCTPLSEYWRLSFEPQNCINRNVHLMAASIITTVTDFLVVLLPIKITTGLDLPPKQSRVVICLFGIGFIASSVGIARTYFTWVLTTDFDLVWNAWAVWFTSTVELNLGIMCASIPATKPFFASILPGIFGSPFRPHSSSSSSMGIDWDARPLKSSPTLTTFIDHTSTGSFIPQRPAPSPPPHRYVNLNKPLPLILCSRRNNPEVRQVLSDDPNSYERLPERSPSLQRGMIYNNRCPSPILRESRPERTTIFIMYQEDDPVQMRLVSSCGSLV